MPILILLLVGIGYARSLGGGFIWDDVNYIVNNPLVTGADGWRRIWFTREAPDFWPVSYSAFWLEWRLWGENPLAFHVVNLLLHGACALLVYRIFKKMRFHGAFWVACLFALHPVNVEAVAWIFQTKTTLAAALALGSLLAYMTFYDDARVKKFYFLALALFVAALLAKTSVVTWPFVILGWAWWRRSQFNGKDLIRAAPFFAVSLVVGLVSWRWYATPFPVPPSEIVRDDGFFSRLAVAGRAVWFYLGKLLWPTSLRFVYPRWALPADSWSSFVPALAWVGAFAVLWRFRKSFGGRAWLLGLAYFFVILFPALGFVNIYFMRFSLVADHYQYLAEIGAIAAFVASVNFFLSRRIAALPLIQGVFCVFAAALLALTMRQTRLYANEETVWRDTIEHDPSSWMAHNSLGLILKKRGDLSGALGEYDQALRLKPTAQTHYNIGMILDAESKPVEAAGEYAEAARLNPYADNVRTNWGADLLKIGRAPEALEQIREAARLRESAQNFYNLGFMLESQGDSRGALENYRRAADLEPGQDLFRQSLDRVKAKN